MLYNSKAKKSTRFLCRALAASRSKVGHDDDDNDNGDGCTYHFLKIIYCHTLVYN